MSADISPSSADTCLNLVLPSGLQEAVSDLLLAHPELRITFGAFPVEARGADAALLTNAEHVSGHAARVQIQLVARHADALTLLQYLKEAMPNPAIFYWIVPVLTQGRLG